MTNNLNKMVSLKSSSKVIYFLYLHLSIQLININSMRPELQLTNRRNSVRLTKSYLPTSNPIVCYLLEVINVVESLYGFDDNNTNDDYPIVY